MRCCSRVVGLVLGQYILVPLERWPALEWLIYWFMHHPTRCLLRTNATWLWV